MRNIRKLLSATIAGAGLCGAALTLVGIQPASASPTTSNIVASWTVGPHSAVFKTVPCPAGSVAVGGGVQSSDPTGAVVTASGPDIGGVPLISEPTGTYGAADGWGAAIFNSDTTTQSFHQSVTSAVSGAALGPTATVVAHTVVSPGPTSSLVADCPASTEAVGGGVDSGNHTAVLSTVTGRRGAVIRSGLRDLVVPPTVGSEPRSTPPPPRSTSPWPWCAQTRAASPIRPPTPSPR